ncbi:MAG: carbon-nitrogen hydrolase family protein [Patulibacter sp.]
MTTKATSVVAAVHAAPVLLDTEATVDKACALIARGGEQGIDLLVFPEAFVPGFPYWINLYPPADQFAINKRYRAASIERTGPEVAQLREAARRAGVNVVIGISERDGGTLYNAQLHIDDRGTLLGVHRKLQPTYAERYVWGQGDGSSLSVFATRLGRVGGLVCWEHMMNLARQALILQGEQIHAASWPGLSTQRGMEQSFDVQVDALSRAHAVTGQCFVVVAQNPLTPEMVAVFEDELGPQAIQPAGGGWSAVIAPDGTTLAGPHVGLDETFVTAEIDLDAIDDLHALIDPRGHYARRDVLRLWMDPGPHDVWASHGGTPDPAADAAAPHDDPAPEGTA